MVTTMITSLGKHDGLEICRLGAASLLALLLPALHGAEPLSPRATIRPSVIRMTAGARQQFHVSAMTARLEAATVVHNVKWSVNDVPGGNAESGTIDANGLFRAPAKTPSPSEIRIGAEVEGVANRFVWATVVIGNGKPAYKLVRSWGEPGDKLVRFKKPHGLTIAPSGEVIVTDEGTHRVVRYSPEGKV